MKRSPVHQQLYEASQVLHRRLDSHPLLSSLFSPALCPALYLRVLQALHHALLPLEQAIQAWERQNHGQDQASLLPLYRPRLPALQADLSSLGSSLSCPDPAPTFSLPSLGAYAGVRYVLEGACLGSVVILRRLSRHDWLDNSLAYWQQQADLALHWPRFTGGLQSLALRAPASLEQAAPASRAAFQTYLQAMDEAAGDE